VSCFATSGTFQPPDIFAWKFCYGESGFEKRQASGLTCDRRVKTSRFSGKMPMRSAIGIPINCRVQADRVRELYCERAGWPGLMFESNGPAAGQIRIIMHGRFAAVVKSVPLDRIPPVLRSPDGEPCSKLNCYHAQLFLREVT